MQLYLPLSTMPSAFLYLHLKEPAYWMSSRTFSKFFTYTFSKSLPSFNSNGWKSRNIQYQEEPFWNALRYRFIRCRRRGNKIWGRHIIISFLEVTASSLLFIKQKEKIMFDFGMSFASLPIQIAKTLIKSDEYWRMNTWQVSLHNKVWLRLQKTRFKGVCL